METDGCGQYPLYGYERRRLPPPPPPRFGENPVKPDLKVTLAKGRLAIKLGVGATPVNDIMVFGSPPRRARAGRHLRVPAADAAAEGRGERAHPDTTSSLQWCPSRLPPPSPIG